MRILMVLSDNTYPPDIRVEKEISALRQDGHEIAVASLRLGDEPSYEIVDGVPVWRMKVPLRGVRFAGRFLELALFRHLLRGRIKAIAREFKPDVIHVHDLPLALPSMKVARSMGLPLVADMHEHYVGLLRDRGITGIAGSIMERILYGEEARVFTYASAVITVVEENKKRIEGQYGLHGKVHVVSNTADTGKLDELRKDKPVREWDLCYVGGISPERGLDTLAEALSGVGGKLKVVIVGGGATLNLKQRFEATGHNVVFSGHMPFRMAMDNIMSSAYALIPYRRTLLTENTIPHKLFQYMYLGTPPIVSDVPPLKRIVEGERCGLVFRAGDAEDMARVIEEAVDIYTNRKKEWEEMAARGRRAVEGKYNWERDAERLREIYRGLGGDS